jgi:hypothetical protein
MKFSTIITIAIIAAVASLAMVDATPVLYHHVPQATAAELRAHAEARVRNAEVEFEKVRKGYRKVRFEHGEVQNEY